MDKVWVLIDLLGGECILNIFSTKELADIARKSSESDNNYLVVREYEVVKPS